MPRTEQIWKDYHGRLHSFIRGRVHDTSEADDILQEVFVRIQSRIGTLKEERKLQSWLYQITRHAIIDHYRSVKKSDGLPEQFAAPEKDAVETARKEIAGCLLPIIQNLPHHYRESLFLSEIEGLSQKEVATQQGLTLSGAKARVQRGRAMVKKLLLDCCRFEFDHRGTVTDYERKGESCDRC